MSRPPSLLDPKFKYRSAGSAVDLANKFKAIRRKMEKESKPEPTPPTNVVLLRKK